MASVPAVGLTPAQNFAETAFDSVNLDSGNVNLHIPIVSFPQLGGKLHMGFMLRYNVPTWQFVLSNTPALNPSTGQPEYEGHWQLWNDFSQNTAMGVDFVRDQGMTPITDFVTFPCLGNDGSGSGKCSDGTPATQAGSSQSTQTTHYSVRDRSGAVHKVGVTAFGINDPDPSTLNTFIPAPDGSGWTPIEPSNGIWPGYSYADREGLVYTLQGVPGPSSGTLSGYTTTITDPNGNQIIGTSGGWTDSIGRQFPGGFSGPGNGISANAVPVEADPFPGVQTSDLSHCPSGTTSARNFTFNGYGGSPETYYLCFGTQQLQTAFGITKLNYGPVASTEATYTVNMMTALVLPNKTSYTFQYDQYGDLTQLTFPTGGSVSYTWTTITWDQASTSNPATRAVATRTVNSLTQPSGEWTYSWNVVSGDLGSPGAANVSVNISKPDGNDEYHTSADTPVPYATLMPDPLQYSVGTSSVYYYNGHSPYNPQGGPGTQIRSDVTTHELIYTPFIEPLPAQPPNTSIYPYYTGRQYPSQPSTYEFIPTVRGPNLSKITTYEDGSVSSIVYSPIPAQTVSFIDPGKNLGDETPLIEVCYCIQYGEYNSILTYDVGAPGTGMSGTLINTTHNNYLWNSTSALAGTYRSANLIDLLQSEITTDANGSWIAETDYRYDENNGGPTGIRGNLTTTSKINNAGSNSNSSIVYTNQGEPLQTIDPNGNITYASAFQCSGLFPKTVIAPYQSSTTQAENYNYVYDCNTGNISSYTDPNSQPTTYAYVDSMSRLTGIAYPDNGSLTINYNGDPTPPLITRTVATGESAGPIVTTINYDGLGRVTKTQLGDPSGTINTDTSYNGVGEIASQSNPYRTKTDPTYGATTYSYDGLERKITQTNPDSSVQQWCFDGTPYPGTTIYCSLHLGSVHTGNWSDFTDENGNHWQRTSDTLGRLTEIMEPDGFAQESTLETDYRYDPLNNLSSITQWGGTSGSGNARVRSFKYDSLNRLLTSINPETGTICYGLLSGLTCSGGYDANGNLLHKTDARGIVTSFSYDGLNRMLSKTYSNDPSGTPFSCYQYDTSVIPSPNSSPNWIGRLTSQWTHSASSGNCAAGGLPANGVVTGITSRRSILGYDQMGRILAEQQCTPSNCTTGNPYTPAYSYNLTGTQLAISNGITTTPVVGTLTFTSAHDAAGRLSTLTSNWSDSTHPPTLFLALDRPSPPCASAQAYPYTPFGTIQNAELGSAIMTTRGYDIRMRANCGIDTGLQIGSATAASAAISITGSEQTK